MPKKKPKYTIRGISSRHASQIVRRRILQKIKPSKKIYTRKGEKYDEV